MPFGEYMRVKKILAGIAALLVLTFTGIIIAASFYDFSNILDELTALVQSKTGRTLQIKGETNLKIGLTPVLVVRDISFSGPGWSDEPRMITAQRFEIALDLVSLLKKKIAVKQFALKKSRFVIETDKNGRTNFQFSQKPQAEKALPGPSEPFFDILVNALVIEDCRIVFKDGKTVQSSLNIKHLTAIATDSTSPIRLDLKADTGGLHFSINGSIGSLSQVLQKKKSYPFDLNGIINGSDLSAKGVLMNAFGDSRLSIKVDLNSNRIIADNFTGPEPDNKIEASEKENQKLFSAEPFDTDFLNFPDLDAKIHVSALTTGKFTFHDVNTHLELKKGCLVVTPFSTSIFDGNFSGNLTLTQMKNTLAIKSVLTAQNIDTQALARHFDLEKDIEGRMDTAFNLTGTGNNMARVMADLDGFAWMSMKDGRVETGFVQALGTDLLTSVLGFLNPFEKTVPYNTLNCAAVRLEFTKGMGEIKLMLVDLPEITASGAGRIDLKKEQIDMTVKPSPKKGMGIKGVGKINLSLTNIARTFNITGDLKNPEVKMDQTGTAMGVVKTIGGIVLLGPVGIVSSLVGADTENQTPCPCALIIARDGNDKQCGASSKSTPADRKDDSKKTSNPLKKILGIFD